MEQDDVLLAAVSPVEPLTLDLDSGLARVSLTMTEWMPNADRLRLQITGLDELFPEHAFKPPDGNSEDGQVEVVFSDEDLPIVRLQARLLGRRRAASVRVTALYQLADEIERRLTAKGVLRVAQESYALRNRMDSTRDKLKKKDPRRAELERQIELLDGALEQLKALLGLCRRIHKAGRIDFRVFHKVDDREIDLFITQKDTPEDSGGDQQPRNH